jgi:hypothetical protein
MLTPGVANTTNAKENGHKHNNSSSSHSTNHDDFTFKFTESGRQIARYFLISFDSKTNRLTSHTDSSGSNLSHKNQQHD